MLVPLYGFLRGDTVGLLVLVHDHQRVAEIAEVLQEAASVRVAPVRKAAVWFAGRRLDPEQAISAAGLGPLDRVDVVPESE